MGTNEHLQTDPRLVREMFARIARTYDLNNRLHSMWRDQAWRRAAVKSAGAVRGRAVLDVACGTGDLAGMFARAGAGRVVGLDFCEEMLRIARRKLPAIEFVCGDAHKLPFADGGFDVLSIAFGIRNLADPAGALREFARVLRPGGQLVVLEFDRTGSTPAARAVRWFMVHVMSRTASALARDRTGAYDYLHKSVQSFMSAGELAAAIAAAGFCQVRTRRLSFGVAALHTACLPRQEIGQ